MNFSAWSIRHPIPAIVLFVVLTVLGLVAFHQLPITKFPNIDVPVVSVTVTQAGAAPAELETQITKKIEDAVAGLTGVKNINSSITDGRSGVFIEFQLEVNVDRAMNDVKDAVAKIRADLPRTIDEPIIERIDVEGQSILTYAIAAPGMTLEQLSWHADDVVKRALQGLKGVGRVDRYGGVDREIRVTLDPDRVMALGATAGEINRQLRAMSVDLAGGRAEVAGKEQTIRTLGAARSVDELANTRIVLSGGRQVRLGDLATVADLYEEQRGFARLDGNTPTVAVSVFRAKGASETDVKRVVEGGFAQLAARHPDISYRLIDDAVANTYGNFVATMHTLIEGAVLAVIVVFLFLRDWRATIVASIALPLSAIPTFFALQAMGFSLNLISLLGITLVTGILVDDAIVEIENIVRHMKMGKSPYRASMEAADEIGLAVIAITFTIVAIFAPVSFMGGIPGQYFKQFGLTVAVAVLFSLLVARLITPMLAAYFMRPIKAHDERDGRLLRGYLAFLRGTLRHRNLTMLAGLGIFALSLWSTTLLPTGFIPPSDVGRSVLSVELPPGATLEDTRRATDEAVRTVREIPEVAQVFVIGGASPTGTREVRRASLYVIMAPREERKRKQRAIEGEITRRLADLADVRAWYVNERGDRELSITVTGNDPVALAKGVGDLEAAMRRLPGFSNVAASAGVNRPEVRVTPRKDEAARLGISTDAIAEAVRVATIGDIGANLPKFNLGDRLIPIRVQFDTAARGEIDLLQATTVGGPAGTPIPLAAVADIDFASGPSSIERYQRARRVKLGADLVGGVTLGQAVDMVNALPEANSLPAGVRIARSGDAEIMGDVFAGFAQAMGAGLMMVLGVLILLFRSVFQPLTIMLSLPLSIGGVILGLLLTGNAISMPVVIGILMLFGIVTKNAILLVDFAVEAQLRGVPRSHAVLEAGRKRARPIIMTTIAMAAGMLPSALGFGDGGEFRSPMAIGVIGGLLVSTLLSLVFVPSLYTLMDDLSRGFGWLFGRFVGPKEEDDESGHATPGNDAGQVRVAAE
jgi:HAE1 family hydrophobic/amphiphilic exporter-1